MVSAVWAGVSQGVGPSPCRVNIYFPRVCTQEEEGCLGVPIWQSHPQTALCSQGEAETQHTCCLRYLLARELGKARDGGKERRGWILKASAQKAPAAVTNPYHKVAVQSEAWVGRDPAFPVQHSCLPSLPASERLLKLCHMAWDSVSYSGNLYPGIQLS